jgi:hypothetical protein
MEHGGYKLVLSVVERVTVDGEVISKVREVRLGWCDAVKTVWIAWLKWAQLTQWLSTFEVALLGD